MKSPAIEQQLTGEIKLDAVPPLEYIYERVSVLAEVQQQISDGNGGYKKIDATKMILKECSGKFEPGTMTAIMGPSGSGKTTLLNLLSGRQLSKNLELKGRIKINGKQVESIAKYKSMIGYVMQEDLMLATFTPRETFRFIADMRLAHKSDQQKDILIESMIQSLGLKKCADTYVGNSLIRGLSGGEKKRTSVGVELLINPSLIFLDEPTTGLDSTTALNLIRFLNRLANSGRTIVTTIHQPSSEIFYEFDHILLMLDGNVIYHNRAAESMKYFARLGMSVPVHSNPMDYYMKIMNKEGIMLEYLEQNKQISDEEVTQKFNERVNFLVKSFKESETQHVSVIQSSLEINNDPSASWLRQFSLVFQRSIINEVRNPLGIKAKIFQTIFFAVIIIILYERQSKTLDSYLQNTMGVLFFLVTNIAFNGMFGSISVFGEERPIFIRERLSNTYETSSYFFGRSFAYVPLELILPLLMIAICYFAVHLDWSGGSFLIAVASSWLATWMASAYGLLLSTAFSNAETATALIPILVIPLMLIGGFFAPLENVPDFYRVFEYISVFKYHYQAIVYSQFYNDPEGFTVVLGDQEFTYRGNILGKDGQFYFEEPFWLSMFLMGIIGLALRALSLLALHIVSSPPAARISPPDNDSEEKDARSSQKDGRKSFIVVNLEPRQIREMPESSMIALH